MYAVVMFTLILYLTKHFQATVKSILLTFSVFIMFSFHTILKSYLTYTNATDLINISLRYIIGLSGVYLLNSRGKKLTTKVVGLSASNDSPSVMIRPLYFLDFKIHLFAILPYKFHTIHSAYALLFKGTKYVGVKTFICTFVIKGIYKKSL
jgi:hypothetical protein